MRISRCAEMNGSMRFQQFFGIAGEQLALVGRRNLKRVERIDCRFDRSERRIGGELVLRRFLERLFCLLSGWLRGLIGVRANGELKC